MEEEAGEDSDMFDQNDPWDSDENGSMSTDEGNKSS